MGRTFNRVTIDSILDVLKSLIGTPVAADIATDIAAVKTDTTAIAAFNNISSANVTTACTSSLNSYDPPTKAEMDTAHALLAPLLVLQEYTSGSGNWTVPAGVYVCDILLVAGGGGGGGCANAADQMAGGGGGAEVMAINNYKVVPTAALAYAVGAGGAGGAAGDNNGTSGANTTFAGLFTAYPGLFGSKGSVKTGGSGGQVDVTGGAAKSRGTSFGGASCMVRIGGGGGGTGNSTGPGGDSVARGGTAQEGAYEGAPGGGSYGAGANHVAANNAGIAAAANSGGGGSGASSNSGGTKAGGAGGSGYIRISWRL